VADVLYFGKPGMILLTGLGCPVVIRMPHALSIVSLIIMVLEKVPIQKRFSVRKTSSSHPDNKNILFVSAGRLYTKKFGCIEKSYENYLTMKQRSEKISSHKYVEDGLF